MLLSKWKITARRQDGSLVLEVPSQTSLYNIVELAFWQAFWPVGALVLPIQLARWIESRWLLVPLALAAVVVWMIPWVYNWTRAIYWLWGGETITIRPGAVEIQRGFGRWQRRWSYEGIRDSSWRVSPWKHHELDWRSRIGFFGLYGPKKPGGALTFTHGRRAVRCGRNFGTRKARVVLREVRGFLGQPVEGKPPKRRPAWLEVVDGEASQAEPP